MGLNEVGVPTALGRKSDFERRKQIKQIKAQRTSPQQKSPRNQR